MHRGQNDKIANLRVGATIPNVAVYASSKTTATTDMLGETWEWQWQIHEWLLEFTEPKEDYMVEFMNSLDRKGLHEYMVEFFKSCMDLHAKRLEAAMEVQAYMLDNPNVNSVPITFIEGKIALPDIAPAAEVD